MEGDMRTWMVNRSIRSIITELDFLKDAQMIDQSQFGSILAQLPQPSSAPLSEMSNLSFDKHNASTNHIIADDKKSPRPQHAKQEPPPSSNNTFPSQAPPPAYPSVPATPLAHVTALYPYTATDAGDLALSPGDRIAVTEYMNGDWWKGRQERSGAEGIFPRSYVKVEEKVSSGPMSYGNMPMAVAEGSGGGGAHEPSKVEQHGKKFRKKLGNAAIFGAGATIGSNIVNSIF